MVGCFLVGFRISQGIKKNKIKLAFISSFTFFLFGILFSRISSSSILNGENFISKALFFVSFLIFAATTIYAYKKSEWKINTKWILIAAWMIPMLLAVRSAVRVFFLIVPFISLMLPLSVLEIWKEGKKKKKDDILKILLYALALGISILLIIASVGFYNTVKYQAEVQTPSYDSDWQKAMGWVRENTPEDSIFLHWWDYGYWVQTGGDRATFSDGGHSQGSYGNHLVARYVLTTPYPETAKSFMKANNISYLLIDPSDIGKYSAYSSIGDDNEVSDRATYLPTLISDPSETVETNNGTIRIYRGGFYVDEDIIYNVDGGDLLLPEGKAAVGAIVIERQLMSSSGDEGQYLLKQPEAVFIYNNNQYRLPLRYLFMNGKLVDYGSGIDATAYVYANIYNGQIDSDGSVMYLSAKTQDSLIVKLYLMDDPDDEYSELELVHSQSDYPVAFSYGGSYRGAIKIYEIHSDEMDDIIAREEFTEYTGEYGGLDDLQFVIQ